MIQAHRPKQFSSCDLGEKYIVDAMACSLVTFNLKRFGFPRVHTHFSVTDTIRQHVKIYNGTSDNEILYTQLEKISKNVYQLLPVLRLLFCPANTVPCRFLFTCVTRLHLIALSNQW